MPGRYPRDAIPLAKENFAFQIREIKKQKRSEKGLPKGKKPRKVNPWPEKVGDIKEKKGKKLKKVKKKIINKNIKKCTKKLLKNK